MMFWSTASFRRLLVIRVACLGMLLPGVSFAQTTTWNNGNGNGNWGQSGNWNSGVPTSATTVQIGSGDSDGVDNSVVNNIQLLADRTANTLIFNNSNDNFSLINGSGTRTLTLTSGDITRSALSSNTQTLAFTTLALGGDAAMNIGGSGSLTISSSIVDSGGARALAKSGTGELILSGANTYSGATTISAGKLTLASASALGTSGSLTMSGGTLKLSTAMTNLTSLTITGTSTIDFGGTDATLNITDFKISSGVTLNIINWVNAADYFFATNWLAGAGGVAGVYDTLGSAPMNQIVFSSGGTKWQSYDNQITPVPEPSTYGALLLASATGLVYWRRRRVTRSTA